jgi:hypothetical protein
VSTSAGGGGRQLSAAQFAQIVALLKAQAVIRRQMRDAAVAGALAPLRTFTAWWDADAVRAMIRRILRVVQPAQLRAARATDVFAAQVLTVMTGRRVRPVGAVDITKLRRSIPASVATELVDGRRVPVWLVLGDTVNGPNEQINHVVHLAVPDTGRRPFADPADPYGRVADGFRYNVVARGDSLAAAQGKARVRIESAAATDITLAVREQYRESFDRERVQGWRRILRPELSEHGPCGLCVVAADRVYRKQDLQPIHDRCVCDVLPIVDGLDPGIRLNADDLRRLYQAAGGTGGAGLKAIRVALAEHGELGPVLVDADQHHRGPLEVAKAQSRDPRVSARAQLDSLQASLDVLERRFAAGELDDRQALNWQRNRVAQLRRVLTAA